MKLNINLNIGDKTIKLKSNRKRDFIIFAILEKINYLHIEIKKMKDNQMEFIALLKEINNSIKDVKKEDRKYLP